MILVDTLRADYLGTYGFLGNVSPHLDRFAKKSVVFSKCFSQAPWTKPSIASLFTSLQVQVHQVESHEGKFGDKDLGHKTDTLASEAVTLAEVLKDGGYATAAFVVNPWIRVRHGFGQGFDVFDTEIKGNGTDGDAVFAAATEWIRAASPDAPYFVYIHLMDVHGPYDAPDEDYEAIRDSPSLGSTRELSRREYSDIASYLRKTPWAGGSGRDVRNWRGRYAAQVHAFDRRIGKFFKDLRKLGVLDRAAIVVTADHGEQLFEHGKWDHGHSLFDEELHVPLIVRLPGGKDGGSRVEANVSLIDVMPTLVSLAGLPAVDGVQGRDLSAVLHGGTAQQQLQSLPSFATGVKWKPQLHAARTQRYKLIKNLVSGEADLYDLEEDSGEKHALAEDSPALSEMNGILQTQLDRNAERGKLEPGRGDLSDTVRERLRALGYGEAEESPAAKRKKERRPTPGEEQAAPQ